MSYGELATTPARGKIKSDNNLYGGRAEINSPNSPNSLLVPKEGEVVNDHIPDYPTEPCRCGCPPPSVQPLELCVPLAVKAELKHGTHCQKISPSSTLSV